LKTKKQNDLGKSGLQVKIEERNNSFFYYSEEMTGKKKKREKEREMMPVFTYSIDCCKRKEMLHCLQCPLGTPKQNKTRHGFKSGAQET